MKKLFTTLALASAVVLNVNAQRVCDVRAVMIQADSIAINCTDSFDFGYAYVNFGPDAIQSGDTVWFIDHNAGEGQAYYEVLASDVNAGDTVVNWWWTDHYDNIVRLANKETLEYTYDAPFANGEYYSPIGFVGFSDDNTTDPNDTNNFALVALTIDCGLGIFENSKNQSISVYPNPTSNALNFAFDFEKVSNATVNVYDITGRLVVTQNFGKQNAGVQNFTLDVSGLSNGNYTLELATDNNKGVSKFVIAK